MVKIHIPRQQRIFIILYRLKRRDFFIIFYKTEITTVNLCNIETAREQENKEG